MEEESLAVAARAFLSDGDTRGAAADKLASACEQLISETARTSLKAALKLALRFVVRAEKQSAPLPLTAYRVLARITHMSGAHTEALPAYLNARKLAHREPLTRARIDRALIDVYMYLGEPEKARRSARAAINTFKKAGAQSDLAQTRVNYGNLLHRQDRHAEAERLYREAAEFFETQGNRLAIARCYYNRANALVQLFELTTAKKLYRDSVEIYDAEGFDLDANDARYGLAWLKMLSGELHTALLDLARCEERYRKGGDPRGEALCTLDRAEVYLTLGLYSDALDSARLAERRFRKLKLAYESAKSALFRAQAAFALGARPEARRAMNRATLGFTREKNLGFLGVTNLLAADLTNDIAKQRGEIKAAQTRFSKCQMPLWSAVSDLRQIRGGVRATAALKRLDKNGAVRHVPHLYALWQATLGDRQYQSGNPAGARRHWQQAADRLDSVRAKLPPIELRSAYARRDNSPHLRLIACELDRDPDLAAGWLERYRTAGLWSPLTDSISAQPHRNQVTKSLEALARHVAQTSLRISGQAGERGLAVVSTDSRTAQIQKQVLRRFIAAEKVLMGEAEPAEKLAEEFRKVSRRLPVIQFHAQEDDIIAFRHSRGETSVLRYRGGRSRLNRALRLWRFILEGELLANHLRESSDNEHEESLWKELGEWLWNPLEISASHKNILVLPESELANLPFQALIANGKPLAERHRFIISPSLRHYIAADESRAGSEECRLFRGAAADLPNVDSELAKIAGLCGSEAVIHNPCRRDDWLAAGDAQLWHFSGHAFLRTDNPFYSYLALEDGPLFAADFRLKNCKVNLVTLASCRTGQQLALPGEESAGLVRSLLEMGARNVVASYWPASDRSTALWTNAFYNSIFKGESLLAAAGQAANSVRAVEPSAYHWAAFALFGAGDLGERYEKQ